MCFICACSYPAAILYLSRHIQYTMNAIWVVSDSEFIIYRERRVSNALLPVQNTLR